MRDSCGKKKIKETQILALLTTKKIITEPINVIRQRPTTQNAQHQATLIVRPSLYP